jgi:hypothetical protein
MARNRRIRASVLGNAAVIALAVGGGWSLAAAGEAPDPGGAAISGEVVGMEAAPPPDKLKIAATWRSRLEMWDFFQPSGAAGANNAYEFFGSDLRASAAYTESWFDLFVEGQAVLLANLPANAAGTAAEGPFGTGAVYRSSNGNEGNDATVYLRQASLKLKKLGVRGLSLKGGRQSFADAKEAIPADPTLAWLQNTRVAERLIGPFDFTYAGRSFDSVLAQWNKRAWTLTGFYGKPTQGGFAIDGMNEIDDLDVAYGSVNMNHPDFAQNTAARLFYLYYGDERPLVKLDNRPLAARQADTGDIAIHTIGADVLQLVPTALGPVDLLGWFAWQTGDWGSLDQSSWALALEAGIQPAEWPWKPWIRAGYNAGSGDSNPNDGTHETFFQVLPTVRQYSLSTLYNTMNTQDAFVQLVLRPRAGLVWRTDYHLVRLTEDDDLWYFGGGATRNRKQPGFGFGGRPSGGEESLMSVLETQISYNWNDYLTTTVYYGHAFGGDVIGADFRNRHANYGFLELTLKLPPM